MASNQQYQEQQLLPTCLDAKPCDDSALKALLEQYPASASPVSYGTAGFRFHADLLPPIMVRVGITAALRSMQLQAPVGVMVTASHNDESYNGVKIADPHGGMMAADGEVWAVQFANERSVENTLQMVQTQRAAYLHNNNNYNDSSLCFTPTLHVGCDTRDHSVPLLNLVLQAAQAATGCVVYHHGVVTTPMLHHVVLHCPQNRGTWLPLCIPPRPNVMGYMDLLVASYQALLETKITTNTTTTEDMSQHPLLVDAACGVGYAPLRMLQDKLQAYNDKNGTNPHFRPIVAVNAPGQGRLNHECGSEHVQKTLQPPMFYHATDDNDNDLDFDDNTNYCASLDGDADRIVFFSLSSPDKNKEMILLDGDKIACLLCVFLQQEWSALMAAVETLNSNKPPLRLGVVQTAYANGASTAYLQSILSNKEGGVVIAKTGVKHVHHAAEENFDVGVYFEANGHGTILFGTAFYDCLQQAAMLLRDGSATSSSKQNHRRAITALQRLSVLPSLVNQAVGDALSDLLLVDAILQLTNRNLQDWNALYQDWPSRQCKVRVHDRTIIKTNDNETKCLEPASVQVALDAAMQECGGGGGRAFIRPSGTEDVVRVYAEASTREKADALALRAAEIVHEFCGGVGELPVFPSSKM